MGKQTGETVKEYNVRRKKMRQENPVLRAEYNAKANLYYHAHKDQINAHKKALREANKETYLAEKRIWSLHWRQKKRYDALMAYGGMQCACCGETIPEFLTIDHINGGGNKHIDLKYGGNKRLGGVGLYRWLANHNFPPGYQVLCYNCNAAKGHYGVCPHQQS